MRSLRSRRTSSFVLALMLCAAGFCTLAEAQWIYRAAPQSTIRTLRAFPNTPTAGTTTLLAATLGGGVWKAQDPNTGANWNWQAANTGLTNLGLWGLTTNDGVTIYAGTDGSGIFKSTDSAATWSASNGSGGTALGCKVVRAINFLATAPATIYAGTACRYDSGLYKSTDSGATWARIGTATIPADTVISAVNLDTTGAQIVLATSNYGIFKSTDSGSTWTAINNGIGAGANAFNITIVDNNSTHLVTYIHGQGVFKTTDGGANWTASNTGLPAGAAALAGISREGNTTLYYPSDKQGIYRSTDSGATWSVWGNTASATPFPRSIVTSGAAGRYYVGMMNGVTKTLDSAVNFSDNGSEIPAGRAAAVLHDLASPNIAYVTVDSLVRINNFYGDYSLESNFTQLDTGITGTTADGVVDQDPSNANVMYASTTNRGLFKSTNAGASWTAINTGLPSLVGQYGRINIDRSNTQILYVGFVNVFNGLGIFKSVDGGANWSAASTGLPTSRAKSISRIEINRNTPSMLYAATGAGLYKSIDSGANWTLSYSALDSGGNLLGVSNVRLNPTNSDVYIANSHTDPNGTLLASSGILKSVDGGSNWTNVLPSKEADNLRVTTGGDVYAGLHESVGQPGVMRSTNAGATWEPFSTGLAGSDVRTFGTDVDSTRILSVSLENGFYSFNRASHDFSAHGKSDLFWRNQGIGGTGQTYLWPMNGTTVAAGEGYSRTLADASWVAVGIGDFNGDGKADVLWRNSSTGQNYIWPMNGVGILSSEGYTRTINDSQWVMSGLGDFDGDGNTDILWHNTATGWNYIWLMEGTTVVGEGFTRTIADANWQIAAVADFDGNGRADILWRNASTGQNYLWSMNALTIGSEGAIRTLADSSWQIAATGDFNGDGMTDILWRNSSTGQNYVWPMSGTTVLASEGFARTLQDSNWQIGSIGDFDGDGKADILWRNVSTGENYIWPMSGTTILAGEGFTRSIPVGNWTILSR
jgi:photosystem II stability/assembly factor-like uncharacterized protein